MKSSRRKSLTWKKQIIRRCCPFPIWVLLVLFPLKHQSDRSLTLVPPSHSRDAIDPVLTQANQTNLTRPTQRLITIVLLACCPITTVLPASCAITAVLLVCCPITTVQQAKCPITAILLVCCLITTVQQAQCPITAVLLTCCPITTVQLALFSSSPETVLVLQSCSLRSR